MTNPPHDKNGLGNPSAPPASSTVEQHDHREEAVSSRAIGSLTEAYEFGQRRRDDDHRCFLVHQLGVNQAGEYSRRKAKPRLSDADREALVDAGAEVAANGFVELEDDVLSELRLLASSAGGAIVGELVARSRRLDPATFIGSGKVEELRHEVGRLNVDLVIVDHDISPVQERNLELRLKCRVLGRTGLILDIFARRAATHEGKMQVELAQLTYLSTRLVRGWSHLERQKGGIGLRGPGETQLEMDRRMLATRVRSLNAKLGKVESQRALRRRGRQRASLPTLSLVGYTNAGKSSLFNRLTEGNAEVADQLFKTLDPVMRKAQLPNYGPAVFSDTVGFIRHLPHDLVTAFHSTLEEVANARLLLHVVDDASAERDELITQVDKVLEEIGADEVPVVMVFNKVDQSGAKPGRLKSTPVGRAAVRVSAHTGAGIDDLLQVLSDILGADRSQITLCGHVGDGRVRSQVYGRMTVVDEKTSDDGQWELKVLASDADRGWIAQQTEQHSTLRIIESTPANVL